MPTPKVSIIIPVYNVENYIERCIDSILNQTFQNFEILLIDDGSTDKSGKICDNYSLKDSRIRVFHKSNGGVSSARNLGIQKSLGEWIYFCDSDDEVCLNGIENLLSNAAGDIKFVMYGYNIDSKISYCVRANEYISPEEAKIRLFKSPDNSYQGYLWSKLFKREVIQNNKLYFDSNIKYNEDRLFIFKYIHTLRSKIFYSSLPVYNHYTNEEGAMCSIHKGNYLNYISDLIAFKRMEELATGQNNQLLKNLISISLFDSYFTNKRLIKKYSRNYRKEIKILNNEIKDIAYCKRIKYWLIIKIRACKGIFNKL